MLNDLPREKLKFIIEEYGRSVIRDSNRCRELLRELAPEHLREINLLMLVLTEGFVWELTAENLESFAQRLHDEFGTQQGFAFWAVESWALALNLIEFDGSTQIASPVECFDLGVKYYLSAEHEQAANWFRKAAEQGVITAQKNLAVMYENGDGVEQNNEQAFFWFKKAAEQGDDEAQHRLGCMYENGEGVEQNNEQAFFWYQKAAEQDSTSALMKLGVIYFKNKEFETAIFCCQKAMEQGDPNARDLLEKILSVEAERKSNRIAAEKGDVEAQITLAAHYYSGMTYYKENHNEAANWFRKAAEQGVITAQKNLAVMYENGDGVEQNNEQAFFWFKKAAEQGDDEAQHRLGCMYENGEGVEQNNEQAFFWYQKAAEQDSTSALMKLGVIYFKNKEFETAIVCYQKAMEEQGVPDDIGYHVEKLLSVEAERKSNRIAAEKGDVEAQRTLAAHYYSGTTYKENHNEAANWFRKAAEQGHITAQKNLAIMYENGDGVEQNNEQAFFWFKKAAEQGDVEVQNKLGCMYANGQGVTKNHEQAVFWCRKSAEQGSYTAQNHLDALLNGLTDSPINLNTSVLILDEATQDFEDMF